jgi:hypothetical protein
LAVSVDDVPGQIVVDEAFKLTSGLAFTTTVILAVAEHPLTNEPVTV